MQTKHIRLKRKLDSSRYSRNEFIEKLYSKVVSLLVEVIAKRGKKVSLQFTYQLIRHRHWQRTNEWSSHEQVIQRKRIWKSVNSMTDAIFHAIDLHSHLSIKYHDAFAFCRYNSLDEVTDSNSHTSIATRSTFYDHVTTLCCLLSRAYDAWRTESCQKHLQRLLFDLTERWVCDEKRVENSKDFRSLMYSMRSRLFDVSRV